MGEGRRSRSSDVDIKFCQIVNFFFPPRAAACLFYWLFIWGMKSWIERFPTMIWGIRVVATVGLCFNRPSVATMLKDGQLQFSHKREKHCLHVGGSMQSYCELSQCFDAFKI